jgi:solute carrier family 45 protein 1/2/4
MTLANLAIQYCYTVQFGFGSPFFLKLGVPNLLLPIVRLSGPFSGFVVQPVVGILSDRCTSSLGRRRPFILFGAIFTMIGMALLASAKYAGINIFHDDSICNVGVGESGKVCTASLVLSVTGILLMNLSINIMQGPSRAIMADCVHPDQQSLAFSLISFIMGFANLAGNIAIFFTPTSNIPFFGTSSTLFFVIGIAVTGVCCLATILSAPEKPFVPRNTGAGSTGSDKSLFQQVWDCAKSMDSVLLSIVGVYFLSWMAYTPLQNYGTTWFGMTVAGASNNADPVYDRGVQYGFLGVACQAIMMMLSSTLSEKVINIFGVKWWYGITQILSTVVFILCIFITSTWPANPSTVYALLLTGLAGINFATFNSVPFALLSSNVKNASDIGLMMGVLNSACVIAQELSDLIAGATISAVGNDSALFIVAAVFSAIGSVAILTLLKENRHVPADKGNLSQPLLLSSNGNSPYESEITV